METYGKIIFYYYEKKITLETIKYFQRKCVRHYHQLPFIITLISKYLSFILQ